MATKKSQGPLTPNKNGLSAAAQPVDEAVDPDHQYFRATTGEPVRIALTTGHITFVETEWTLLNRRFWSHAFAMGCETKDGKGRTENLDGMTLDQRKEAILAMMQTFEESEDKAGLFNAKGIPDSARLTDRLGFPVGDDEVVVLWDEFQDTPPA